MSRQGDLFEQRENLERVYARIAPMILMFAREQGCGAPFRVETLRRYVRTRAPGIAPDSPGRVLRQLRLKGALDYVVVNRRQSLYQFKRAGKAA